MDCIQLVQDRAPSRGLLLIWWWTIGFHKRWGIPWRSPLFQEALCPIELVSCILLAVQIFHVDPFQLCPPVSSCYKQQSVRNRFVMYKNSRILDELILKKLVCKKAINLNVVFRNDLGPKRYPCNGSHLRWIYVSNVWTGGDMNIFLFCVICYKLKCILWFIFLSVVVNKHLL
jgi:hypothetical protein